MIHPTLERIPGRGITKEEHDNFVETTGRPYTEPYRFRHLGHFGANGQVARKSDPIKRTDPKTHPPRAR